MAIFKELISKRIKGTLAQTEDWWRLCYDSDEERFFVEHQWDHVELNGLSQNTGTIEHDADAWKGEGASEIPAAKLRLLDQARK